MPGELLEGSVVVRAQSEANRIHNKGRFGRPLSGGGLRLDLLEATYLAEVDRLTVERGGALLRWADLLVEATRSQPGFEVLYLVYRDLRERGYLIESASAPEAKTGSHFRLWPRGTQRPGAPSAWLRAVSERSPLALAEVSAFAEAAQKHKAEPRIAVVDEESDLTYYELATGAPSGSVEPRRSPRPADALLLADRVLVADPAPIQELQTREFLGKPVASGLQLGLVESAYLMERGDLRMQDAATGKPLSGAALRKRARDIEPQLETRLAVYTDLKRRGLIVKTGFKFGTHFRAYDGPQEEAHAPYLVQAVPPDYETAWEPVARAVRLSHSVRKRFYFAIAGTREVWFVALGRFRP